MDNEKAYNEALERARRILCNIPEGPASARDIETIFPELTESEDERIRKELVALFIEVRNREGNEGYWHDLKVADILAWLEKQKEQQSIQDKEEREYVRTLKSLISDFLRGKDEIDRGYYQKIYDWLDGRHIEQKPEWSEENEKMRNLIVAIFEVNHPNGFFKANEINTTDMHGVHTVEIVSWLKSLRPQPKQEWSEEDEKTLDCIINTLDRLGYAEFCKSSREEDIEKERFYYKEIQCLKKLKSLRPSWKPTKEQMKALEECGECKRCIKDLYEQLQRLM